MGTVVWVTWGSMVSVIGISIWSNLEYVARKLTLLDHGLDSLVDVVVLVLASNDGSDLAGGLAINLLGGVDVAGALLSKTSLNLVVVAMLVAAVLNRDDVGVVLGRKNLLVDDRLLGGVVVILVNLLVDGRDVLLVLLLLDSLMLDSRGNLLMNSGVVVARLGHEVLDGSLSRIHCDLKLFGVGEWG